MLPCDMDVEREVLHGCLVGPLPKLMTSDFCYGEECFNGWLYGRLRLLQGDLLLPRLLTPKHRAEAARRGVANLAGTLALIMYERTGRPRPLNMPWAVDRLKRIARLRKKVLGAEDVLRWCHEETDRLRVRMEPVEL